MAYDEALADRIRELLAGQRFVEKRMFGGLAFLVAGHMAVAASGQGGLMVRVDPTAMPELLAEPGAGEMEMRGRIVRGWLRVDAGALTEDEALEPWVRRGVASCATLPSK
jgi:hypothetical protein